jgi:hypothetical protein
VPIQLELSGREKGQNAQFTGLTLRRFTGLRPYRFVDAPPIDAPADDALWRPGRAARLQGRQQRRPAALLGAAARRRRSQRPICTLRCKRPTAPGAPLATLPGRRLAGYTYPFTRWQPGEIVTAQIRAGDWLNTAEPQPGQYRFTVRVYDGNDPGAASLPTDTGAAAFDSGPVVVTID